jgi:hypothetical protein
MATDMGLSVQNFLMEILPKGGYDSPFEIFLDSSSAIHAAVVPAMLPKFKHIPIHAQKVRTHAQLGDILLRKIGSTDNTADQGTKPYTSGPHYKRETGFFMKTHEELLELGYTRYVPE